MAQLQPPQPWWVSDEEVERIVIPSGHTIIFRYKAWRTIRFGASDERVTLHLVLRPDTEQGEAIVLDVPFRRETFWERFTTQTKPSE